MFISEGLKQNGGLPNCNGGIDSSRKSFVLNQNNSVVQSLVNGKQFVQHDDNFDENMLENGFSSISIEDTKAFNGSGRRFLPIYRAPSLFDFKMSQENLFNKLQVDFPSILEAFNHLYIEKGDDQTMTNGLVVQKYKGHFVNEYSMSEKQREMVLAFLDVLIDALRGIGFDIEFKCPQLLAIYGSVSLGGFVGCDELLNILFTKVFNCSYIDMHNFFFMVGDKIIKKICSKMNNEELALNKSIVDLCRENTDIIKSNYAILRQDIRVVLEYSGLAEHILSNNSKLIETNLGFMKKMTTGSTIT